MAFAQVNPSTVAAKSPADPAPQTTATAARRANTTSAASLGTVIFTRAEREGILSSGSGIDTSTGAAGAKPSAMRFDGYAKPERGPAVVWINGQTDARSDGVQDRGSDVIIRSNRQHGRLLKPGQTDSSSELGDGNTIVLHENNTSIGGQRVPAVTGSSERMRRSN